MMGHNVWHHINAVQLANQMYDQGTLPKMLAGVTDPAYNFKNIVEDIFSQQDRDRSLAKIEYYSRAFELIIGTRGFTGKKTTSARGMFNTLFKQAEVDDNDTGLNSDLLDNLENSL